MGKIIGIDMGVSNSRAEVIEGEKIVVFSKEVGIGCAEEFGVDNYNLKESYAIILKRLKQDVEDYLG